MLIIYKGILHSIISKLYNIHGTSVIKTITIGNKLVQQQDINYLKKFFSYKNFT